MCSTRCHGLFLKNILNQRSKMNAGRGCANGVRLSLGVSKRRAPLYIYTSDLFILQSILKSLGRDLSLLSQLRCAHSHSRGPRQAPGFQH